jgi:hypothetical protein
MSTYFPNQVPFLELEYKHIEVLASAPCSEVYATIGPIEPISIREISAEVGRSTASVGEHISKLLAVNLIIPVGTRKRRAREETLYARACVSYNITVRNLSSEASEAYITRFRCQMRQIDRYHAHAQKAIQHDPDFADFFAYRWQMGYMDRESAIKFKEEMSGFLNRFRAHITTDPEIRAKGDFVRVQFSATFLPTQRESEKVRKK